MSRRIAAAVAAVTFAVFLPALDLGFTAYDDNEYVTANRNVTAGLSAEGIVWAFGAHHANWHPLTWMSHMADASIFGLNPLGHHLTSVVLHAAGAALLTMTLGGMTGAIWPAAVTGVLFGVHPLRVESVAWVAERKDVLCGFFWFLALGAHLRYARSPGLMRQGLVMLAAAAALMAKPMAVTLPAVLLLLDVWPLGRLRGAGGSGPGRMSAARLVLEKLPLLTLSAAAAVLTYAAQSSAGTVLSVERLPLAVRFTNAILSCVRYLGKALWPASLAVHYPLSSSVPPLWKVAAAVCLLLGVTLAVLLLGRRRPWLPVGWLWYLGTLLPVLGVVQVGMQAMADRYTYLPLVGVFAALGFSLEGLRVLRPRIRRQCIALCVVALVAFVPMTWSQIRHWRSGEELFRRAVTVNPGNWVAHDTLGVFLARSGRLAEAEAHHREAIRLAPSYQLAYYHLGICLQRQGRTAAAVESFRIALSIDPLHAESHNNLGYLLLTQGHAREAVPHLEEAVRLAPGFAVARANLGNALMRIGRETEGRAMIVESLKSSGR